MKYYTLFIIILLGYFLYTMSSCTDKLPEPAAPAPCDTVSVSYNVHIKSMLDSKCSYGGCHDGSSQSPDLTSYPSAAVQDRIYQRAVVLQTMPPAANPQLTSGEIDSINCWKEGGFLEN